MRDPSHPPSRINTTHRASPTVPGSGGMHEGRVVAQQTDGPGPDEPLLPVVSVRRIDGPPCAVMRPPDVLLLAVPATGDRLQSRPIGCTRLNYDALAYVRLPWSSEHTTIGILMPQSMGRERVTSARFISATAARIGSTKRAEDNENYQIRRI